MNCIFLLLQFMHVCEVPVIGRLTILWQKWLQFMHVCEVPVQTGPLSKIGGAVAIHARM